MNRERAKELLPIIQAFAEGKDIQWRNTNAGTGGWLECKGIIDSGVYEYRIKPEPFECWVNVCGARPSTTHPTLAAAADCLGDMVGDPEWRIIHMVEKT